MTDDSNRVSYILYKNFYVDTLHDYKPLFSFQHPAVNAAHDQLMRIHNTIWHTIWQVEQ